MNETSAPIRDVFLSHSGNDKSFVRKLAAAIEQENFEGRKLTAWVDEAEIRPGQSIPGLINFGLERSRFIAFVMTPNYFTSESGWTDAEWHAALHADPDNRKARLLPLIAADCPYIPILLRHLRRLDLRGPDYARGLNELLSVLRDEPLPRPITVRGQLIQPAGLIDRATLVAERSVPDADPDTISENLSCNLLPVERLPEYIYRAGVADSTKRHRVDGTEALPTKQQLREAIRQQQLDAGVEKPWTPAFRLIEDKIISFHELDSPELPLAGVVNGETVEQILAQEFIADEDDRRVLISLLNMGITRYLLRQGLVADSTRSQRFYFRPKEGRENVIEWKPFRKLARRTVAKPIVQGDSVLYWLHQAAYIKATFLAAHFYIQITPTWLLTEDGEKVKGGPEVGRVVIKWAGQERNISVLYHVRFWTSALRHGPGPISIQLGEQSMEIAKVPAFIRQAYGVKRDQRDLMRTLDEVAPLLAMEEDTFEIQESSEADEQESELVTAPEVTIEDVEQDDNP
jgi:hypothetical protein